MNSTRYDFWPFLISALDRYWLADKYQIWKFDTIKRKGLPIINLFWYVNYVNRYQLDSEILIGI